METKGRERDLRYELVRSIAFIFMVGVHANGQFVLGDGSLENWVHAVTNVLFLSCNGLYFFLSGKFALGSKFTDQEDIKVYYKKKLIKFLLPMLIYMFLRTLFECRHTLGGTLSAYLKNTWNTYSGQEYWFLYVLVGNLLLAPFIGKALKHIDDRSIGLLMGILFFFNTLETIGNNIGLGFAWKFPLDGWSAYFYLGYCIERFFRTQKKRRLLYIFSIAAFLISVCQVRYGIFAANVSDLSPAYLLMVSGVFMFLTNIYKGEHSKLTERIIRFIGKYSFAAYMIHLPVLQRAATYIPDSYHLVHLLLLILVGSVGSLCIGFVLQTILVMPLVRLLEIHFLEEKTR